MTTKVGFFLYNPFPTLSVASAVELIRCANSVTGQELYSWEFFTIAGEDAYSATGFHIRVHGKLEDAKVDVLIVCATNNAMHSRNAKLFVHLRRIARRGIRIGGISGGPVLLARAGLLDGRRYTAHWEHGPALREEFPHLDLRCTLFEMDGPRFTCAGGGASLDMTNALIAAEYGPEIAQSASDFLLHTHIRQGDESQRMSVRHRFDIAHPILIKAIGRLEKSLGKPLDRQEFATELGLSLRQIERLFEANLQTTINKYHIKLRIYQARTLIKQSTLSLSEIAIATGFVNFSHFSRIYKKTFGMTPREHRKSPLDR